MTRPSINRRLPPELTHAPRGQSLVLPPANLDRAKGARTWTECTTCAPSLTHLARVLYSCPPPSNLAVYPFPSSRISPRRHRRSHAEQDCASPPHRTCTGRRARKRHGCMHQPIDRPHLGTPHPTYGPSPGYLRVEPNCFCERRRRLRSFPTF